MDIKTVKTNGSYGHVKYVSADDKALSAYFKLYGLFLLSVGVFIAALVALGK